MQRIERLIIQAQRQATEKAEKMVLAFVNVLPDRYKATCILYKGKNDIKQRNIEEAFDTMDKAISFAHKVSRQYQNENEDVTIICFTKASDKFDQTQNKQSS